MAVAVEDHDDLRWCVPGIDGERRHGGELGGFAGVHGDLPVTERELVGPDSTNNQSWPGWTCGSLGSAVGSSPTLMAVLVLVGRLTCGAGARTRCWSPRSTVEHQDVVTTPPHPRQVRPGVGAVPSAAPETTRSSAPCRRRSLRRAPSCSSDTLPSTRSPQGPTALTRADHVQPADVAAYLDDDWDIEIDETRPRTAPARATPLHARRRAPSETTAVDSSPHASLHAQLVPRPGRFARFLVRYPAAPGV